MTQFESGGGLVLSYQNRSLVAFLVDEVEAPSGFRRNGIRNAADAVLDKILESLTKLRESPDYELCQFSEQKPDMLDELAAERKTLLEKESAELEKQASQLAEEIKELSGQASDRIV